MSICYLNGKLLPLAEAKVSVLDRGFIFGDAVYEVVPVKHGRIFAADEHIARLGRNLLAIGIDDPHGPAEWIMLLERLVRENGSGDQAIYLQVTRGPAERELGFPVGAQPTVFAMSRPLPAATELIRVDAITLDDLRWRRCDIKTTSLLANVLLRGEANARNAYEAILLREGVVTEGTASNVFVVTAGTVRTPPQSNLILPGVTRSLLVEVLSGAGLPVEETDVAADELRAADEIWLTSSTRDLIDVKRLDGEPVGREGGFPVAREARARFEEYVTERQRR